MPQPLDDNGASLQTELINALLKDKKAERLWKNVRALSVVGLLAVYGCAAFFVRSAEPDAPAADPKGAPYVSLVRIIGEIGPDKDASAERLNPSLAKAFADPAAKGVVLVANSPGGTPVQAALIHDRLVQLRAQHKKKVVVVAEDMLTSGAYFIAVGADKIVVNRSTIAGSVGVISHGFGFTGLMDKLGVERRTLQAGTNKNRMDPFGPVAAGDKEKMESVLGDIHRHFIDTVKQDRKGKLQGDDATLFNGDFWAGEQAVRLGLADELSDLPTVLEKEFGVKKMKDYSVPHSLWDRLTKTVSTEVMSSITARSSEQAMLLPR